MAFIFFETQRRRETRRAITGESVKNRNAFPSLTAASTLCKAKFNEKTNDINDITIKKIQNKSSKSSSTKEYSSFLCSRLKNHFIRQFFFFFYRSYRYIVLIVDFFWFQVAILEPLYK
jgi:hypothetical protein